MDLKFVLRVVHRGNRIEKTIRAAQRQCGSPKALEVSPLLRLEEASSFSAQPSDLPQASKLRKVIAWENFDPAKAASSMYCPGGTGGRDVVLIGPEAGFAEAEVGTILDAGYVAVSLGPWVLRAPNAIVAALSFLRGCDQRTATGQPRDAPGETVEPM